MALVINTNISALNSQRQLLKSGNDLNQATERLASGRRINSAKDDAAGLAISNRQTSQIRGLDQAVRNANDGISLIQTAEGALEETTNILQRMRELAIQSSNGIYTDTDRATLDAEVQQLVSELDRIAEQTTFNGQNLLDGSLKKVDLQVGSQANQTISLSVQAMDAKTLGMGSTSVDLLGAELNLTATSFAASVDADIKDGDVLINGQSIGTFDSGASGEANTLADLVSSINENVNGVTAAAITELQASQVGSGVIDNDAGEGLNITVTELNGATQTYQIRQNTNDLDELVDAINTVTGGEVNASVNDDGELILSNNSGSTVAAAAAGGLDLQAALGMGTAGDGTSQGGQIVLTSDNGDPITVERGSTGGLLDLANLGFRESAEQGTIEGAGLSTAFADTSWGVGDVTINGTQIANKNTDSLSGKINAINAATSETGVTANAFATVKIDMSDVSITAAFAATADIIKMNGIDVDFSGVTSVEEMADVINGGTNTHGVVASVLGNSLVLESDQGAINFSDATATTAFTAADSALGFAGAVFTEFMASGVEATVAGSVQAGETIEAGIKLTSNNGNPISIELGVNANGDEIGLLEANNTANGSFGTALASVSVDTAKNAQKAIDVIDNALETINSTRADLGAINNRLDFAISNLSNVSEKTSAARSRIVDADFAMETSQLSRAQVLQQASTAMLAQSNARPQQVLSLLQ